MSILKALSKNYSGLGWCIVGEDYDTLEWQSATVEKPSLEALQSEATEIAQQEDLAALRAARDVLLLATDWWVLPDRSPTQQQIEYRQALRDITNHYTSLTDVVWPTKPA